MTPPRANRARFAASLAASLYARMSADTEV